jgi:hypothetical protein
LMQLLCFLEVVCMHSSRGCCIGSGGACMCAGGALCGFFFELWFGGLHSLVEHSFCLGCVEQLLLPKGEDHVWFEDRWMVTSLCDEWLTTLWGLILG